MQKKIKILLIITAIHLMFSPYIFSQTENPVSNGDLNQGVQLFKTGRFDQALPIFEKLVNANPDDAMLNYYYSASLVEQNIFTDKTNQHLLKAVSGNMPDKIFYYVGKYFQEKELWNSALKYYNRYKNYSSEEEKNAVSIDRLIQYCYSQADPQLPETVQNEPLVSNPPREEEKNNLSVAKTEPSNPTENLIKTSSENLIPQNNLISFQVNAEIEYK